MARYVTLKQLIARILHTELIRLSITEKEIDLIEEPPCNVSHYNSPEDVNELTVNTWIDDYVRPLIPEEVKIRVFDNAGELIDVERLDTLTVGELKYDVLCTRKPGTVSTITKEDILDNTLALCSPVTFAINHQRLLDKIELTIDAARIKARTDKTIMHMVRDCNTDIEQNETVLLSELVWTAANLGLELDIRLVEPKKGKS